MVFGFRSSSHTHIALVYTLLVLIAHSYLSVDLHYERNSKGIPQQARGGWQGMACYRHRLVCRLWWCSLRVSHTASHLEIHHEANIRSYDTGTISGILAMPYWQRLFSTGYTDAKGNPNITTGQESSIVSILSAGTFFGALSSPFMSDYIGRRPGLMIATWVFNLGVALQTAATSIPMFLAGRFFAGFGVGQISAISKFKLTTT